MNKDLYTVVVADDETELREAVCQMIPWEEIGYKLVGSAGNGLDALQLVEQLEPDLLLTDIQMPFISGVELARQVRELRPTTNIVFLSGYDDFEYAQKAIEYNIISYLLKPIGIADLSKALQEVRAKIEAKYEALKVPSKSLSGWLAFVAPLLLDEFTEEQDLDEAALARQAVESGYLPEPWDPLELVVVAVELRHQGGFSSTPTMAKSCNLVLEQYYRSRSFFAGSRILCLLASEHGFDQLPVALDELEQTVSRLWETDCTIGCSHPVRAWSRCRSACREAVEALRTAPAGEKGMHQLSQPVTSCGDLPNLSEMASRLEVLLRGGSREEMEAYLTSQFAVESAAKNSVVIQAMAVVQRVLYGAVPAEQALSLWRRCRLPEDLFTGGVMRDLPRKVIYLCLAVRDLLLEQRRDGVSLLCDQALEIINRNYMKEEISLGLVSEELHVSPNYLSANMKKYVGDTFINLLIKKRMEVAGELLQTTNLKILEVARQCGYSDQHYFSYCFKKYYGQSPLQMRRGGAGKGETML